MFKRSFKYILLLVVNIIVLIALYPSHLQQSDTVFDTEYVIELLDTNKQLQEKVVSSTLQAETAAYESGTLNQQLEFSASQIALINTKLKRCELQQKNLETLIAETRSSAETNTAQHTSTQQTNAQPEQQQCPSLSAELNYAQAQLRTLHNELSESDIKYNDKVKSNSLLGARIRELENDLEKLLALNVALKENLRLSTQDLLSDTYIKKIYKTVKFCQQPRFEERVCVESILVRPEFSKKPSTPVVAKLISNANKEIAQMTFGDKAAQLVTFSFPNGTELDRGDYQVIFELDGLRLIDTLKVEQPAK